VVNEKKGAKRKKRTDEPTLIQNADTHGSMPRTFSFDPQGRLLVAGNQTMTDSLPASLSLAVSRIGTDGKLDFTQRYDLAVGRKLAERGVGEWEAAVERIRRVGRETHQAIGRGAAAFPTAAHCPLLAIVAGGVVVGARLDDHGSGATRR
jgi:hypothetical protein